MLAFARLTSLITALAVTGCATSLRVHEVSTGASGQDLARIDGIVVNKRATYAVNVVSIPGFESVRAGKLKGAVDHDKMVSVNICRYPFATGKLTLGLNDHQQTNTLELSGEPGLANAITATTEALATKAALEKPESTDEDKK